MFNSDMRRRIDLILFKMKFGVRTGFGGRLPMDNRMLNFYPHHHHPLLPIPPSPNPHTTHGGWQGRAYTFVIGRLRARARALALASRPAVRLGQTNGPNANGPGPTRLGPNGARANASGLIRPEALEFAPPLDPPHPPPTHHIPNCCPHCEGGGWGGGGTRTTHLQKLMAL